MTDNKCVTERKREGERERGERKKENGTASQDKPQISMLSEQKLTV